MQVYEIFESFHGEANGHHQGRLVTFLRFSGCNLSCNFCDTKKAIPYDSGNSMSVGDIVSKLITIGNKYVCLTGGEPLMQKHLLHLLKSLQRCFFKVSIESNGSLDIAPFRKYVDSFVLDYKLDCPEKMERTNYPFLTSDDIIKFVIKDEEDFKEALRMKMLIENIPEGGNNLFAFSPCFPYISPKRLSDFILNERRKRITQMDNLLFSLQIHKIIGFE